MSTNSSMHGPHAVLSTNSIMHGPHVVLAACLATLAVAAEDARAPARARPASRQTSGPYATTHQTIKYPALDLTDRSLEAVYPSPGQDLGQDLGPATFPVIAYAHGYGDRPGRCCFAALRTLPSHCLHTHTGTHTLLHQRTCTHAQLTCDCHRYLGAPQTGTVMGATT